MHRWTAQALRTRQPADDHRARCHRAGLMRRSRLRQTTRDVTEGIEATQNFLDAGSMDNAAQIALEVCAFLKQNSTLDLASFARHARQALPTSHDTYKLFADDEAQALMALGATSQAVERYVELVRDHEALAASDPGRADYQRDVSVSYEKLGDLQQTLGDGDQALKLFTASLEIRERLAAAEPGRADYQRDVSVSYNKLGDMLAQAGDRAQAERYYRDSLTIAERLAPADPFTQALRGKLEGLGNDGEATPPD
jgi:tetratricopeptide (TPR) repeat protein